MITSQQLCRLIYQKNHRLAIEISEIFLLGVIHKAPHIRFVRQGAVY